MQEITDLISNLGFPIVIVLGLGFALYKLALLYMTNATEREGKLMDNNAEIIKIIQKLTITIEKINDKIDLALDQKKEEKEEEK